MTKTVYSITHSKPEDAWYLAMDARQADVDEIWASNRMTIYEAAMISLEKSRDPCSGWAGDRLVCMFGVTPFTALTPHGSPWMLGTNEVVKHWREFARSSRLVMDLWTQQYDALCNFVDARNTLAVQWLQWLGFTLLEAQPHGPDRLPFYPFVWKK